MMVQDTNISEDLAASLKMEAVRSSEMLVSRRHNPENLD